MDHNPLTHSLKEAVRKLSAVRRSSRVREAPRPAAEAMRLAWARVVRGREGPVTGLQRRVGSSGPAV